MRIVKPDAKVITGQDDGGEYGRAYSVLDTIEISDAEWDEIGEKYYYHKDNYERNHIIKHRTFSQYLRELIFLAEHQKKRNLGLIVIEDGNLFEGTIDQWEDNFGGLTMMSEEDKLKYIENWSKERGYKFERVEMKRQYSMEKNGKGKL